MLLTENKYTNVSGVFPNALMIDASGAGLTDGSEFAALPLNDGWEPFSQAIMSYASGVQLQNSPTGGVGVPNGVADAVGVSQMIEAIQKSIGNGPGNMAWWGNELDPSVTGDRILLLAEQGVLIAVYPGLDAANYVGDGTNAAAHAAGLKFYRSSDAGGATPNIAGPYIQLPAQPSPLFLKQYSEAGGYFTVTGTNWTTARAVCVPYQTIDGAWRLIFDIDGGLSVASASLIATISGVTFKNITDFEQACSLYARDVGGANRAASFCGAVNNTSTIEMGAANAVDNMAFSGDVELDSKPAWADDFEFKLGIRY